MKILIVTPFYAPAWGYGGPPKLLHEFALALKKRGHVVKVVTCDLLDDARSKPNRDSFEGVSIYRLKTISNSLAWKNKIILPLGAYRHLDRVVEKFDFVFCSDLRHILNIATYRACRKHSIPYSIAAYGEISITNDWKGLFKKVYDSVYGRRIARNAAFLFAQTDHEMEAYRKYAGDTKNTVLFPLALDMDPFNKLPAKSNFRNKYNLSFDDKVVLFVGRFNRYKGIDKIIKCLHDVKSNIPNIKLVLVGRDDGYLTEMKTLIKEYGLKNQVIITPPLYNDDTIEAYSAADVFIITPSHPEETSLASLAALACGCPVVVNENCQIPWLDENNAGVTIGISDSPDRALLRILKYAKVRQAMGANARQLALAKYSWESRVKDFEILVAQSGKDD